MSKKLLLYARTIRHLRLGQIAGQIRKPFAMKAVPPATDYKGGANLSLAAAIPALDQDSGYLARFDAEKLLRGEFCLLNETRAVDLSTWATDASPLWRFNLHYFEYAVALAARYRVTGDKACYAKFRELVQSWICANPTGVGDGWHPYTISMRLPNLCICFDLFGDIFRADNAFYNEVLQSMYMQYRVLLKRQETWQRGNHYFENLKTIVLCSLLFDEGSTFDRYIVRFLREVREEILPDGVHFELSIMYHKIILEDILRAAFWLRQAGRPQYESLLPVIQKMVNALASLENGMGKTPLFNDAGDGIAKTGTSLLACARELFDVTPALSDSFPCGGYYKLYDADRALLFDAGEIGPPYMPGHGHCDCLSFELSAGGRPIFVNSGTYQYQGDLRGYFRSTQAHNTLIIGDREQSECWGEHRVARRISDLHASKNGQTLTGSYRSYSGDTHTRTLTLENNALTVTDSVKAAGDFEIHSYLHLAPSCEVVQRDGKLEVFRGSEPICEIKPAACRAALHKTGPLANYSGEFGVLEQGQTLEFYRQGDDEKYGYIINFNIN